MKIIDYIVVNGSPEPEDSPYSIGTKVRGKMKEGYQPYGSAFSYERYNILQPMVKYE